MSVSLSEQATSTLLVHFFDALKPELKEEFMKHIIDGTSTDGINEFVAYLKDPDNYVNHKHHAFIGGSIFIEPITLTNKEFKYYTDKGYIKDEGILATIVDFQFIPDFKIICQIPGDNPETKRTISTWYIKNLNLL